MAGKDVVGTVFFGRNEEKVVVVKSETEAGGKGGNNQGNGVVATGSSDKEKDNEALEDPKHTKPHIHALSIGGRNLKDTDGAAVIGFIVSEPHLSIPLSLLHTINLISTPLSPPDLDKLLKCCSEIRDLSFTFQSASPELQPSQIRDEQKQIIAGLSSSCDHVSRLDIRANGMPWNLGLVEGPDRANSSLPSLTKLTLPIPHHPSGFDLDHGTIAFFPQIQHFTIFLPDNISLPNCNPHFINTLLLRVLRLRCSVDFIVWTEKRVESRTAMVDDSLRFYMEAREEMVKNRSEIQWLAKVIERSNDGRKEGWRTMGEGGKMIDHDFSNRTA